MKIYSYTVISLLSGILLLCSYLFGMTILETTYVALTAIIGGYLGYKTRVEYKPPKGLTGQVDTHTY